VEHQIELNHETTRRWAHQVNHVKRAHKRKKKKPHPLRDRMPSEGMLLQMDGSSHDWLGNGIRPSLIGNIDDASSKCCSAEFFPAEDRFAVMTNMKTTVETYGVPEAVYLDQAAAHGKSRLFRKFAGWQDHITDFERALTEIGCRVIFASSAQAKGRIERMWNTFQDRLIPELRLRGIKTIPSANKFLKEHFIPYFNQQFSVLPVNPVSAWRPLSDTQRSQLNEIFCLKEYRKIQNGEIISFCGQIYVLKHDFDTSLAGMRIEIRTYLDGTQKFFYAGREVAFEPKRLILRAS
jgi:hypothetical protein